MMSVMYDDDYLQREAEDAARSRVDVRRIASRIGVVWPQFVTPEDLITAYPQLCLFVKDVLYYAAINEHELDNHSRKVISERRKIEPRSNVFTDDMGFLVRDLLMHLRNKMHVDSRFQHHRLIKPVRYSRRILQEENGRVCQKMKDWITFRTRKHFLYLGTLTLPDFFIYLAYVSKFCVTLMLERTPFNEIQCVGLLAAETIYQCCKLFPNYGLLQRFARVKKLTLVQELFLMNNR